MLLLFLLNGLAFAGTNNWCPANLQEQNCFACSGSGSYPDYVGNTCRVCEKGYVHFKKGDPCITAASLSSQVQASVTAENIVFMQSSSIYDAYKDIWSSSSDMYNNKFYLQKAIAAVFVEKYGDNVDFAYITSHQYEGGCNGYTTASACNDRAMCNWSSNECRSTGGMYPHEYGNFWPETMFDQMHGTIFWQPSFESMSGAFGTHFHEMGHHWLVHWNQYSQKNNWPSHQGTTGMERWGIMGGFDKSTITCDDPQGQSVTNSNSCNSSGGKTYLRFPAEKGTSQFQTSDTFGTAQYSDWELFAMGMKSVEDMGSQTMMDCWASGQQYQMEQYPSTGTLEGHIIPCTEINFYTAQQLKDADSSWREPKSTFSVAHIILIPDDVTLPIDFESMPEDFQKLSNWLKDDLPGEFVKATRGAGTITYRFSDAADDDSTSSTNTDSPSNSKSLGLLLPFLVFSFKLF